MKYFQQLIFTTSHRLFGWPRVVSSLPISNLLISDFKLGDELFLWYGWATKGVKPYFQPGPLSEILTIANLWHAASRRLEPAQNLSSGFVEWSCAVAITTTIQHHSLGLVVRSNVLHWIFNLCHWYTVSH